MNSIKIHPGYLRLLVAEKEKDQYDIDLWEDCRGEAPLQLVNIEFYEEGAYGIGEIYVVEDPDGNSYGRVFYRALGKYDYYDELDELVPEDPDDMENQSPEDWVEFYPVKGVAAVKYEFGDADD